MQRGNKTSSYQHIFCSTISFSSLKDVTKARMKPFLDRGTSDNRARELFKKNIHNLPILMRVNDKIRLNQLKTKNQGPMNKQKSCLHRDCWNKCRVFMFTNNVNIYSLRNNYSNSSDCGATFSSENCGRASIFARSFPSTRLIF